MQSSKDATCKLEVYNFAKKRIWKMSLWKYFGILKTAFLQNQLRNISMMKSTFNKIVGIGSRHAILLKTEEFAL